MARGRRTAIPDGMTDVRNRIECWRTTREKRSPMPEELWSAAVALAKIHGVYATARALTINYETLKKRIDQAPAPRRRPDGATPSAGFVELDGLQLVRPSGAVVELSRSDGAKLTIRLPAGEDLDVGGLAAAFWSCGA